MLSLEHSTNNLFELTVPDLYICNRHTYIFIFVSNYHPQMKLREDYVFTPVCQSLCLTGSGVHFPLGRHPLCSPSRRKIPPGRHPSRQTPPRQTATEKGGMRPTGMHSCDLFNCEILGGQPYRTPYPAPTCTLISVLLTLLTVKETGHTLR